MSDLNDNGDLVAMMNLMYGYPLEDVLFIGFFMYSINIQRQGIGTYLVIPSEKDRAYS